MVDASSALQKPEVYETRRVQLTSPMLHIGSAVSRLSPFEYVQTGKFVYQPDQNALAKALKERGHLDNYIRRIEDRDEIVSLLEKAFGENWQTAVSPDGQPIFPRERRSLRWTEQRITDLRPMIRNGWGQLYIPGSSIKGAIRTAIAYHLLKNSDRYKVPKGSQISDIENRLRQSMGNLRQRAKFFDDATFMDELFTNFSLNGNLGRDRTGPNTDFMRAVQISDCDPLIEEKVEKRGKPILRNLPVVAEVLVSSRFSDYRAKYRASIYTELVRNVRTQFTISLDYEMLAWFRHNQGMQIPFKTIDELIKICEGFAQEQWDFEHDYWINIRSNPNADGRNLNFNNIQDIYKAEQCPYSLRLGWASGLAGTTINLLIQDELRSEIRDTCGIRAVGFEAPKSRRTIVSSRGDIQYVPGWTTFKVL